MTATIDRVCIVDLCPPIKLPERLSVTEFAERRHVLSSRFSSYPGPLRLDRTPYMRDVLEAFTDPAIDTITLKFGSQCAKTTGMEVVLNYAVHHDPGPCIWCLPSEKSRDSFVMERLKPSILASESWASMVASRGRAITRHRIDFVTMPLFFAVADSEADLASKPARFVFADEIGKFPESTAREGSPLDQLRARQRTFATGKFVQSSTPTSRDSGIDREYNASDRRRWMVPCLKCGAATPWRWKDIHWPERDPKMRRREFAERLEHGEIAAWWECPECGHKAFGDAEKQKMNDCGYWQAEETNRGHAGFHLPSLASMFTSFNKLASNWQLAIEAEEQGNIQKRKHFTLHELAEGFVEKRIIMEEQTIVDRVDRELDNDLPKWADILSLGADLQWDRLYWVQTAWGRNHQRCHVMDFGVIEGDVDHTLAALLAMIRDAPVSPGATAVDSGDGAHTETVYRWALANKGYGVWPIKGASAALGGGKLLGRSRDEKASHRGRLWNLDTDKLKSFVSRLMSRPVEHEGRVSFCAKALTDEAFQRQLCAEQRLKNGKWALRPGYADNHFWDATVYATAAAHIGGLFREASRAAPPRQATGTQQTPYAGRKGW